MNEYTVIWKQGDIDDYEYSYVMADEPDDIDSQTIIAGVQNNECKIIKIHLIKFDNNMA